MAIVGTTLTEAGIKSEFFQRLGEVPSVWQDFCTVIKSNTKTEHYGFMGRTPPMSAWGTGRLARGMFSDTYDVTNERYEVTLEVDRIELDDDQTGQIRVRIGEMASRAAQHKDMLLAHLLANGASAGYLSYDGVPFFDDAHESGKSGIQSNLSAPAATDPDNPTSTEFRTAFGQAVAQLLGLLDDQGEPMNLSASGLVCVVPSSMYVPALEAISATMLASTQNVLAGAAKVATLPHLSDSSCWYLLKTDVPVRAFIFQDRDPIEFNALEGKSDEGFLREKFLYGCRARYAMSYAYWQHGIHVDFTGA